MNTDSAILSKGAEALEAAATELRRKIAVRRNADGSLSPVDRKAADAVFSTPPLPPDAEAAARELRSRIAERRGSGVPAAPLPSVGVKVSRTLDLDVGETATIEVLDLRLDAIEPLPTRENPAPFKGAFSSVFASLESAAETVGGKILNLIQSYGVTERHKEAGYGVIDSAKHEDFEPEMAVEILEHGNVLDVGLEGFEHFKILKIFDTEFDRVVELGDRPGAVRVRRLICAVDLKTSGGRKGRRELLITFPLRAGELLTFHDPITQQLIAKKPILSIGMNRKTVKERFLSLFS